MTIGHQHDPGHSHGLGWYQKPCRYIDHSFSRVINPDTAFGSSPGPDVALTPSGIQTTYISLFIPPLPLQICLLHRTQTTQPLSPPSPTICLLPIMTPVDPSTHPGQVNPGGLVSVHPHPVPMSPSRSITLLFLLRSYNLLLFPPIKLLLVSDCLFVWEK